jgi:hypothetical protein
VRRIVALLFILAAGSASAQTFRSFQTIPVPDPATREAMRLRGAAGAGIRQVPRDVVEEAVHRIYSAYNTPDFRQYLSERFYDPERLVEAIAEKVPREAVLRLVSLNSIQTVSQQPAKDELGRETVESLVLVVVRAQMEFTNAQGFQRREGESELVLRFRESPR